MEINDITEEDFAAYEEIRQLGCCNMLSAAVRDLAGIDKETHTAIIKHYEALCAKWPDVRE